MRLSVFSEAPMRSYSNDIWIHVQPISSAQIISKRKKNSSVNLCKYSIYQNGNTMKRILSSLIFLGFLIISQMQLVHAFDMRWMDMTAHHAVMQMEEPIFCETSSQNNEEKCIVEILPYKILSQQNWKELIEKVAFVLPLSFPFQKISWNNPAVSAPLFRSPDLIFQKTKYTNLVGIIKMLD